MTIPSVIQGTVEVEGKVFELDSPKGATWLQTIGSFRFEPTGDGKPCTIRKEASGYWYGCRKVAGKVRKKYIGKTSEVSTAKLEEIAEALEVPPVARVKKVAEVAQEVTQVAEVAQRVTQVAEVVQRVTQVAEVVQRVTQVAEVAQRVTQVAHDRLTALELEVANLRKALEALQEALPGKLEAGDSEELPKVDSEVAEGLQNDLGNLKVENEKLKQELADARTEYAKLLESSTAVKASREKEFAELRSQLEQERADREEVEVELAELTQLKKEVKEHAHELHLEENSMKLEKVRWQRELSDAKAKLADTKATILHQGDKIRELERGYSLKPNPAESRLRLEIGELQAELAELKQKSATASKDLPEAADILNQLKSKRKKSKAELADVEKILEILEGHE
jgi:chromosome segregation ATPase